MKLLWLVLICMSNLAYADPSGTVKILPDFINTSSSVVFLPVKSGESTTMSLGLLVTAQSTKAWTINLKADPFTLEGTTEVLKLEQVSYRIFDDSLDQMDEVYYLPREMTPVYKCWEDYWQPQTQNFDTTGTTITLIINIQPRFKTIGRYRSKLYVELGL